MLSRFTEDVPKPGVTRIVSELISPVFVLGIVVNLPPADGAVMFSVNTLLPPRVPVILSAELPLLFDETSRLSKSNDPPVVEVIVIEEGPGLSMGPTKIEGIGLP
jgi:hypothetical protein